MDNFFQIIPLGEVLRFGNGKSIKPGGSGKYLVYGSNGVIGGSDEYRHENGIIIGRVGAYCGSVSYCPSRFWASDNTLVAFPSSDDHDTKFLYYLLVDAKLSRHAGGAAQPLVTQGVLKQVEVSVPPLPIQRRIAGILSAYDDLIENSQRRIKILEEIARRLYREWFVHFRFPGHEDCRLVESPLGEIPEGWEVKVLGDISSYINRGITPKYKDAGESLVINQKCVRDQSLSLIPARRQSKIIPPDKQIRFADLLINSTGVGTLGRVAQVYRVLDNCTVDSHVTIARPSPGVDPDFYGCCVLNRQDDLERLGVGATGQTELGREAIAGIEVAFPPKSLQSKFGSAVRCSRQAVEVYKDQIQNLRRTRDLLLPRLLSGQIDVEALPEPLAFEP